MQVLSLKNCQIDGDTRKYSYLKCDSEQAAEKLINEGKTDQNLLSFAHDGII